MSRAQRVSSVVPTRLANHKCTSCSYCHCVWSGVGGDAHLSGDLEVRFSASF